MNQQLCRDSPSDSRISASESRAQNWCDRCLFRRVKVEDSERKAPLSAPLRLVDTVCWKYVKTSCSKSPNPENGPTYKIEAWKMSDPTMAGNLCSAERGPESGSCTGFLIYEPSWCATSKNGGCYIAMFSFVLRFCKLFCSTAWIWVIVLTSVWNSQVLQPFIKHVPHEVEQTHLPEVTWGGAMLPGPWVYPVLFLPPKRPVVGCTRSFEWYEW